MAPHAELSSRHPSRAPATTARTHPTPPGGLEKDRLGTGEGEQRPAAQPSAHTASAIAEPPAGAPQDRSGIGTAVDERVAALFGCSGTGLTGSLGPLCVAASATFSGCGGFRTWLGKFRRKRPTEGEGVIGHKAATLGRCMLKNKSLISNVDSLDKTPPAEGRRWRRINRPRREDVSRCRTGLSTDAPE